jgi:acyl-coenzyme A synthetase/AMP-(fatty) acid ligase
MCALTQKDVLGHCNKNLEPFMIPKYVEFVESLPKTANGKVYKKQLNTRPETIQR